MESAIGAVVIPGILIRVVLDVTSLFKQSAALDFAYGGLFVVVALVLFVAEGASIWAFACLGIAAFSFMAAAGKLQAQTSKSGGSANGAP